MDLIFETYDSGRFELVVVYVVLITVTLRCIIPLYMAFCIELRIVKRKTKRKREKVKLRRVSRVRLLLRFIFLIIKGINFIFLTVEGAKHTKNVQTLEVE